MFVIKTKFKIRKHIKKFELQFECANVRNQRKFMNVGWNTPPNQSNMENSYFCVETCWMKFCSGTNFIQHHPTWFFSSFSKLYKFCNCANHSNISSNMAKTWCWMKCWTGLLRPLYELTVRRLWNGYKKVNVIQSSHTVFLWRCSNILHAISSEALRQSFYLADYILTYSN